MSNSNNTLANQKKMMYMTSLLSETLPPNLLDNATLQDFGIDKTDTFGLIHIQFDNKLKHIIDSKDSDNVAYWKKLFHEHILNPLETIHTSAHCLLNMAPYTRIILFSFNGNNPDEAKKAIQSWFTSVLNYLDKNNFGRLIAVSSTNFTSLQHIGKTYKQLRLLMNYRYTLGMGSLTFYEEMSFKEDYSITEYKYLQRYETLLSTENYEALLMILDEIYEHISVHKLVDSKVIYIYKELISITIRHLYGMETMYLKEIANLNNTINNFEATIDDALIATAYLANQLNALQTNAFNNDVALHPHISRALRIVSKYYSDNIGLSSVADTLNLSSAYLSRLFRAEMGVGFKDYLTRYRLNIIKDLLENSNKSLTHIAQSVGYNTPNQMTRIFKKYEQTTPSDYRHQLKTKQPYQGVNL